MLVSIDRVKLRTIIDLSTRSVMDGLLTEDEALDAGVTLIVADAIRFGGIDAGRE